MAKGRREKKNGYVHEPRCKICTSRDAHGKELRSEVEKLKAEGAKHEQILDFLDRNGIPLTEASLINHNKKHAPYLSQLPPKSVKRVITQITHQAEDSRKTIEKIIGMGTKMVDNWWKDVEGPQLPVTERLFMEALKEEGRRAPRTAIDQELDLMEQAMIEGEEEEIDELESEALNE